MDFMTIKRRMMQFTWSPYPATSGAGTGRFVARFVECIQRVRSVVNRQAGNEGQPVPVGEWMGGRAPSTMPAKESIPVEVNTAANRSMTSALLESLRPGQWAKNGFVFAPLIFSLNLRDFHRTMLVTLAAVVFSAISSATYLFNDFVDADEDRRHPTKCLRPVASGRISGRTAATVAAVLAAAALSGAWAIEPGLFKVVALYAAMNLCYSLWLKHVTLVEVFLVAAGFVLRVIVGGVVIHVELSTWLVVCTTFLALFLVLSKRRHEMVLLGDDASNHRSTLASYSPYFLDQLIGLVSACTVMSYSLYTLSADVRIKFPGKRLELTIPFVLFGIFRYLYSVHRRNGGGSPTRTLLTDPVLLLVVLLWAASVILIIYS